MTMPATVGVTAADQIPVVTGYAMIEKKAPQRHSLRIHGQPNVCKGSIEKLEDKLKQKASVETYQNCDSQKAPDFVSVSLATFDIAEALAIKRPATSATGHANGCSSATSGHLRRASPKHNQMRQLQAYTFLCFLIQRWCRAAVAGTCASTASWSAYVDVYDAAETKNIK